LEIIGTGSALPRLRVSNQDLASVMDTSDEWIINRTGIRERRICDQETLTDLAAQAAVEALKNAGIEAEQLDFIICPTLQGDYVTPALACQIQGRIGARCPALDINGACTGFLYALDMAEAYLQAGRYKYILIICAEALSKIVNWQDRSSAILFGDGAGAAVVTKGDSFLAMRLATRSNEELLYARPDGGNCPFVQESRPLQRLVMNGKEVYKFAVSSCVRDLTRVAREAGVSWEDIDYFIIHQANLRIIEGVRQRLEQPAEKFPANIQHYGNTSSASIPILLDELNKQGKLQKGMLIALSAFGAGLNTGACLIKW